MAKNLTNCNLKEFMLQTRLIKHHVEKWLTETDIMNIRKNLPELPDLPELGDNATPAAKEEYEKLLAERKEKLTEQGMKNASAMFDAIFDEHPEDTITLIALLCFVPADEIEDYPMTYYMESITEMLNDTKVWDFFISLAVAAQRVGITTG